MGSNLNHGKRFIAFVAEVALMLFLGATVWYASHLRAIDQMKDHNNGPPIDIVQVVWKPYFVYAAVAATLFLMIYLGTSRQITPLNVVMPFFREGFKAFGPAIETANGAKEDGINRDVRIDSFRTERPNGETVDETSSDRGVIDQILTDAAESAEQLAYKMENRINLHLTFGVLTGGIGLVVWYMTFYRPGITQSQDHTISGRAFDTLPRITILIFVELLAGFFLRQYRIGVEDLKYFLELKRRADAKRIAYIIFERIDDPKAKLAFAKQLLQERSDTRLGKDEMTTTLYAIDKEKNEFINGLESIASKLGTVAKELKGEHGKAINEKHKSED